MKLIEHVNGCGGPAFYLKMCGPFDAYPSSHVNDIQELGGSSPPVGELLRCGTCGEPWSMTETLIIKVRED
jgi:hypothetical protein